MDSHGISGWRVMSRSCKSHGLKIIRMILTTDSSNLGHSMKHTLRSSVASYYLASITYIKKARYIEISRLLMFCSLKLERSSWQILALQHS